MYLASAAADHIMSAPPPPPPPTVSPSAPPLPPSAPPLPPPAPFPEGAVVTPHADGRAAGAPGMSLAEVLSYKGRLRKTGVDTKHTACLHTEAGGEVSYGGFM